MDLKRQKTMKVNPELEQDNIEHSQTSISPFDLKEKASLINKTMFKTTLNQNRLEKLEREALRGECQVTPEAKIIQKSKKKPDLLTLILKSEHKTSNNGTKIIKLPKLPFGKHQSYNEEPLFKEKHFFEEKTEKVRPERLKDLEDITRKFRLHEKRYKANKRGRLQTAKPMLSSMTFHNVYKMGPGDLVCDINQEVINSYERDKQKFLIDMKGNFASTFKNMDQNSPEQKYLMRRTMDMSDANALVSRLMPSQECKDTELSLFYVSKYASLFITPEPKKVRFDLRRSSA